MKRYTGQQALYEAISRSRAKAQRRSIIERLRPETTAQDKPAPSEGPSPTEPLQAPVDAPRPVAEEPPRPAPEKPREPAIVRANAKLRRLAALNREVPQERHEPTAAPRRSVEVKDDPPAQVQTPWRVRPLQLNAGRIEVSVPYHMGIVVALAVILAILASFRIGQKYPGRNSASAVPTKPLVAALRPNAAEITVERTPQPDRAASAPTAGQPVVAQGDHWIVLVQHKEQADLEPVVAHFAKHGIELGIVSLDRARQHFAEAGLNAARLPSGTGYLLVTVGMFSNPEKPGTNGYAMKQKIVEVGAQYRAPAGRETFAARRFSDAYGMKIQ